MECSREPGASVETTSIAGGNRIRLRSIHVIPIDGGVARRVTWNGSGVQAVGWSPDGKKIIYRGAQEANYRAIVRLYAVSPEGVTSQIGTSRELGP
jgi:Tol biopolymer transport system component